MEPCWPPKSNKIRCHQNDFLKKTLFLLRKNNDFEGSEGRSWAQKSIKNRLKNDVILGRYLGIDFSWILVDFGSQVGAKLGSKIDKKSIQKGIEKQMPKRRRQNRQKSASWGVLGRLKRHLGATCLFWVWVRRMRGGHSKAYIRPKSFPILNTPLGHPCQAGGRRIVSASRTRRGLQIVIWASGLVSNSPLCVAGGWIMQMISEQTSRDIIA